MSQVKNWDRRIWDALTEDGIKIRGVSLGDGFGRLRVSDPETLFDSKLLHDDAPLFWDDSQETGSGTTSTHSTDKASVTMGVALNTAGKRTRQTFQRFNYQPGKSHLILCTGTPRATGGGTGVTTRMGHFDDQNGHFLEVDDGALFLVRRSYVTGSAVDTRIAQADWNLDTLDGDGPSGVTLDPTKSVLLWMDMEWLGVGSVRMGVVVDGQFILAHAFHHANVAAGVYMSTPNLPLRYQIENDGTGAASTMEQICGTVISEGGAQPTGARRYASLEDSQITLATAGTMYLGLGARLKSTHLDATVAPAYASVIPTNTVDLEWVVYLGATIGGGTPTWTGQTNAAVDIAQGNGTLTLSGGTAVAGGYLKSSQSSGQGDKDLDSALRLGSTIAGSAQELTLGLRPLGTNLNVLAGLGWRELS